MWVINRVTHSEFRRGQTWRWGWDTKTSTGLSQTPGFEECHQGPCRPTSPEEGVVRDPWETVPYTRGPMDSMFQSTVPLEISRRFRTSRGLRDRVPFGWTPPLV